MLGMRLLPSFGCCAKDSAEEAAQVVPGQDAAGVEDTGGSVLAGSPQLLRTVGWVSAALGAVALGLIVGRELRQRYKFNRRTPYDMYSHSGDELRDVDFGVGI